MIDKRLLKEMPEAKVFIWKQVIMQWIGMLSNVAMVFTFAYLFTAMFEKALVIKDLYIGVMIVVAMIVVRIFVTKKASTYSYLASRDVKNHLRKRIYEKLLEMKNSYTQHIATSELVQLSVEGVDQLETYFGRYLPQFFYSMLAPITLFLILVWMDWKSAVVLLVCVPLIPLSIVAVQKFAKKLLSKYWTSYATLGDSFLENLQGLTTLKIYQADEFKNEEMNKEAENFRRITMKVLTMQLNSVSVMDIVAYGGAAIGSIVAVMGFVHGSVSLFSVICIVLLSSEFFIPLRLLGSFFHIAMNGIAASNKIFNLLDLPKEEVEKEVFSDKECAIKILDLSYSYDGEREVLHNIQMEIPSHKFISIVGESGSGKSTIAKLIVGLAKGYKGKLLIQDIDRMHLDDSSFYSRVMYITHKATIFKGSVKDNLVIAKDGLSEQDMWYALQQVKLADFIRENGGLDMVIEENGTNLSGGQRQRLAMARALLADKEVYIFDEATSNIDMDSEDAILDVIKDMAKKKTIIMISHRLSTVTESDCIYVMNQGRCDSYGTHDELMMQQGIYADMYHRQADLEAFYKEEA